jgi:hypothetical protein
MARRFAKLVGYGLLAVLLFASGNGAVAAGLQTDPSLRSGMEAIRASIIENHTLITHRRMPVAMARSFAASVEQAVGGIRESTAIPSEARAVLDPLLRTIEASATAIGAGGDSIAQMDALFAMTKALETYGQTFDHPDWKPIQER